MEFLKSVSAEKARAIIDQFPRRPGSVAVSLEDALDRVLAEEIVAMEAIPSFSRSLVDGFAVFASETQGARETNPVFLEVSGRVGVGEETAVILSSGRTVEVSTGAMIPGTSDGVVMEEYVRRLPEAVEVTRPVYKGENICFAGEDIKQGQSVMMKGKRLTPFDLGVLAALGHSSLSVFKRPLVAVISSGDEIMQVSEVPPPGKVRDINRYAVSGLIVRFGGAPRFLGIVKDERQDVAEKLREARDYDMILISGGSSKGERDFVTDTIEGLGGAVHFHGINIKPGKPTIFGTLWDKPIFGLPGHPGSCGMAMIRFVVPLLRYLAGEESWIERKIRGRLTTNIPSSYGIEEYVRVTAAVVGGEFSVTPLFAKSSVISPLARAYGYVIVPEGTEGFETGEEVEVYPFE
jgi:molybdopterin molybdotransferase